MDKTSRTRMDEHEAGTVCSCAVGHDGHVVSALVTRRRRRQRNDGRKWLYVARGCDPVAVAAVVSVSVAVAVAAAVVGCRCPSLCVTCLCCLA